MSPNDNDFWAGKPEMEAEEVSIFVQMKLWEDTCSCVKCFLKSMFLSFYGRQKVSFPWGDW